jgi:hypothetical protein
MSDLLGALERSLERAAAIALRRRAGSGHRTAARRAPVPEGRDVQRPCFPDSAAPADGCLPGSPAPDDGCFPPGRARSR